MYKKNPEKLLCLYIDAHFLKYSHEVIANVILNIIR